jgi:hypothetical protein
MFACVLLVVAVVLFCVSVFPSVCVLNFILVCMLAFALVSLLVCM